MGIGLVEKYDDVVFINFVEFKKVEINGIIYVKILR